MNPQSCQSARQGRIVESKLDVMHRANLRVLLAIAVIGSSTITTARAALQIDQLVDKSETWTIGYNKSLKGCIASATSKDRTTVWIGFAGSEPNAPAYLAFTSPDWRFIEPRKFYEVEIRAVGAHGRAGYGSGIERSNEKGVFVFGVKWRLLEELGEGSGLLLSINKGEHTLVNISGSSEALEKLLSCQRRNIALKPQGIQPLGLPEDMQRLERQRQAADQERLPRAPAEQSAGEGSIQSRSEPTDKTRSEEAAPEALQPAGREEQAERQNAERAGSEGRSEQADLEQAVVEQFRTEDGAGAARQSREKGSTEPEPGARRRDAHDKSDGDADPKVSGPARSDERVAAAPASSLQPPADPGRERGALVRAIKQELMRVGCYDGRIDEDWQTPVARASVQRYATRARLTISPAEPTNELLDSIRARSERVCPVGCGPRKVEKEGRCIAKGCPAGFALDDDGDCVVRRKTVRRHEVEEKDLSKKEKDLSNKEKDLSNKRYRQPASIRQPDRALILRSHDSKRRARADSDRDRNDDKEPAARRPAHSHRSRS